MINAMRSSAGSEYDIKEKYFHGSDKVYDEMTDYVESVLNIKPARLVTTLSTDTKFEVARQLQVATMSTTAQISKFLHMKIIHEGEE